MIFVGHAGLDKLASVADVWRALPIDHVVEARWWRVPADAVPRAADRDVQERWLYDWWARIDAWITQNTPPPGPPAARHTAARPQPAGRDAHLTTCRMATTHSGQIIGAL